MTSQMEHLNIIIQISIEMMAMKSTIQGFYRILYGDSKFHVSGKHLGMTCIS